MTKDSKKMLVPSDIPELLRPGKTVLMPGRIFASPHGISIWDKKKKAILSPRKDEIYTEGPVYLIEGGKALGIIIIGEPREVDLERAIELKNLHCISDLEIKNWWKASRPLYYYPVRLISKFDPPKSIVVPENSKKYLEVVKFESMEFADPGELLNEELLDAHGKVHKIWATIEIIGEETLKYHIILKNEMLKRKLEHENIDDLDEKSEEFQKQISKENFKVTFLGTKGLIKEEGPGHRFHTSILYEYMGEKLLIDYGEMNQGNLDEIKPDYILVSHAHPDHLLGLNNKSVIVSEETEKVFSKLYKNFGIDIKSTFGSYETFDLGPFKITSIPVLHSLEAPTYAFLISLGKKKVLHATDILKWHPGDKEKYIKDLDLAIIDGSSLEETISRREGKVGEPSGHESIRAQLKNWYTPDRVKKIIITHLGKEPISIGDDELTAKVREMTKVSIVIAKDGVVVDLSEKLERDVIFKPYPSEHSCRLKSPDKYNRFARKNCYRKSGEKCIHYIFGIKEGKSETQSMRYSKNVWTAGAASAHCKSAGGSFVAALKEKEEKQKFVCECLECGYVFGSDEHCRETCLSDKVKILLLDGRSLTIPEIINELKQDKELWVYSSKENGEFIPQRIVSAQKTKFDKMLKITLDNDKGFECTYEHLIMMRNGIYERADNLKIKDSVMPFYTMISEKSGKYNVGGYRFFRDLVENKWRPVHLWVVSKLKLHHLKGGVVHHQGFDKLNNNPDELQILSHKEHRNIHIEHLMELRKNPEWMKKLIEATHSPEAIAKRSKSQKKWWRSEDGRKCKREILVPRIKRLWEDKNYRLIMAKSNSRFMRKLNANPTEKMLNSRQSFIKKGQEWMKEHFEFNSKRGKKIANEIIEKQCSYCGKLIKGKHASYAAHIGHCKRNFGLSPKIKRERDEKGRFIAVRNLVSVNHRIIKIEKIKARQGYDIGISGIPNFAINAGIFVHNSCPRCGGKARRIERPGVGKSEETKVLDPRFHNVLNWPKIGFEFPIVLSEKIEKRDRFILEGFAGANDLDFQNDIITDSALRRATKKFVEEGKFCLNHTDEVIGKILECHFRKGKIWLKVEITEPKIIKKIKSGELNCLSVKGEVEYEKVERVISPELNISIKVIRDLILEEVSLVPQGANFEAKAIRWYVSKAIESAIKP